MLVFQCDWVDRAKVLKEFFLFVCLSFLLGESKLVLLKQLQDSKQFQRCTSLFPISATWSLT